MSHEHPPTTWQKLRAFSFHMGIVLFCLLYVSFGAFAFYRLERPVELRLLNASLARLHRLRLDFARDAAQLVYLFGEGEQGKRGRPGRSLRHCWAQPAASAPCAR